MTQDSTGYLRRVVERLQDLASAAQGYIDSLGDSTGSKDEQDDRDELVTQLVDNLRQQQRLLCDAFEKTGSTVMLSELGQGFAAYGKDLAHWDYEQHSGHFISPVQQFLWHFTDILRMSLPEGDMSRSNTLLKVLENILAGTAMIMQQQGIEPKNEADVNRLMRTVVSAAFPDTISNPGIPTIVKTYRPEFAVPSLGAVVEYKFANSQEYLKQCIDGIMADSRAYQTDHRWRRFYAVIFMTSAWYTQAQIDLDFRACGIADFWHAVVLVGKSGRTKKTLARQEVDLLQPPPAEQPQVPEPERSADTAGCLAPPHDDT